LSNRGSDEVAWALKEKDGKELWVTRLGPAVTEGMRQGREGPGSSPTVDGDRLYVLGAGGTLACLNVQDGKIRWRKSLIGDFGGKLPTWRYSESPLVDGGNVICTPGAADAVLIALDKMTGELVWKGTLAAPKKKAVAKAPSTQRASRDAPAPSAAKPRGVVAAGSTWKYLDNGSAPGSDWTSLSFDDGKWRQGPAQLGYGDGDEKTRLSSDPDSYPTYYFRRAFDWKESSPLEPLEPLEPLVLRLMRDDGAVVYINGREVVRDNMPTGSLGHGTFASRTAFVEDDYYTHGEVYAEIPLTFGMEGDEPPGGGSSRRGFGFGGRGASWWRPGGEISKPFLAHPRSRRLFLERVRVLAETVYTEEVFGPKLDALQRRLELETRLRARASGRSEEDASRYLQDSVAFFREHLVQRRKYVLENVGAELAKLDEAKNREGAKGSDEE